MGNTHYYGHLFDAHGRGKQTTGAGRAPTVIGHFEIDISFKNPGGGYLPRVGQRVESINTGDEFQPAGIIVAVHDDDRIIVELATGSERSSNLWPVLTPNQPATSALLYERGHGWAVDAYEETIEIAEGGPGGYTQSKSLRIKDPVAGDQDVSVIRTTVRRGGHIQQTNDKRMLECTPQDRLEGVYWDPRARIGGYLDIDLPFSGNVQRGEIVTASGGATFVFLCPRPIDASTLRIYYADLQGTPPAAAETLTGPAPGNFSATVADAGDPTETVGAWVPYSATPHMGVDIYFSDETEDHRNIFYSRFVVPPRGNAGRQAAGVGPESRMVKRAYDKHQPVIDSTDRSMRWLPYCSLDQPSEGGQMGGILHQVIVVSGASGWGGVALGATITSSAGSWTAKFGGINGAGTRIVVYATNGETLAAGTISSGAASATNAGPAIGWQKGSQYWNDFVAELTAARAADGALYPGSPELWEHLFVQVWEGDISAAVLTLAPLLISADTYWAEFQRWMADLRTLLGNQAMTFSLWSHIPTSGTGIGSQYGVLIGGSFPASTWLYLRFRDFAARSEGAVKLVHSEGLEMEYADLSAGTLDQWGNTGLFLRTHDYLTVGERMWASAVSGIVALPSQLFEPIAVVVVVGQSQLLLQIPFSEAQDADPSLYPTATFNAGGFVVDTRDERDMVWNFVNHAIETFDCRTNALTSWLTNALTTFGGADVSLHTRLRARYGKVAFFYLPVGGSCLSPTIPFATGCWHPTAIRPAVTVEVDITTDPIEGTTTFTAAAGTFNGLLALLGGGTGDGSVVISGHGTSQSSPGGYDTPPFARNNTPVAGFDPTGASITIDGELTAANDVTLTFTAGPPLIWPYLKQHFQEFIASLADLGYVPRIGPMVKVQGDSDLVDAANYLTHLTEFWDAVIDMCALRIAGDQGQPKVEVLVSQGTPWGTDTELETLRAAQIAWAAAGPDRFVVDPSKLPHAAAPGGSVPVVRTLRQHNDVHFTGRSGIHLGFLIDQGLEGKVGIPAHPDGDAVIMFGGPVELPYASEVGGADDGGGGEDTPGDPGVDGLVVEDGTGYDNADSFVSVADADTILDLYGTPASWTAATTAAKAQALRRATAEWLEGVFHEVWRGYIQVLDQRLSWPRVGARDDAGRLIAVGTVPWQIVHAQVIVAADIVDGGIILPTGYERGAVLRETKKAAGFETTLEYAEGAFSDSSTRRLRRAESLIYPLVDDADRHVVTVG